MHLILLKSPQKALYLAFSDYTPISHLHFICKMINKTFSNVIVIGIHRNAVNTKIEPSYESSKNKMSTGGLEPPQLSPHAPQACVSTIPPHRHKLWYLFDDAD